MRANGSGVQLAGTGVIVRARNDCGNSPFTSWRFPPCERSRFASWR